MIRLYFANPGAGKTTLASAIIQKEYKRMLKGKSPYKVIYCNAKIENSIYLDVPSILRTHAIENALIVIDEASIVYNNRIMKMTAREIEFFKLHRHYKTDIVLISQSFDDVDITLRRMYDRLYILRKLPFHFTIIKEIKKFITIDLETKQIVEGYEYTGLPKFLIRKRWYKYFNSYWIPEHIPIYQNTKALTAGKVIEIDQVKSDKA